MLCCNLSCVYSPISVHRLFLKCIIVAKHVEVILESRLIEGNIGELAL